VLTFTDLPPLLTSDRIPQALPSGAIRFDVDPQVLVKDEATYVGEPIAMVVAETRRAAEDALPSIALDIEPLPAVTDPCAGLESGAPKARMDCPDNLVARQSIDYGDVDGAFARAAHRIKERYRLHKGGGHSIETRGIAVRPDPVDDTLTIYANTQMPHRAKQLLVAALGIAESRIRVVAPDSGGGFGPKAAFHPEELALPAAALLLGRPLKWVEDRRENFVATVGERDQDWDMEAAFDAEGRLLALRGKLCHDHGSCTPYGVALAYNAGTNVVGPYVLPTYRLDINWCLTNFVPCAPTRGAGRPQGMYVMERLLDAIATKLNVPRDEIRRRNMIQPSQMPYPTPIRQRDGSTMAYDSGDYPECQRRALEAGGWADFPARQAAARREGRYVGLGLANYVEATGRGPFESASLRIGASGKIVVTTGASAQGQGTKSMLAQLAGDVLNVPPDSITVVAGDTAGTAMGFGAFASRQTVTAGNAVHRAAIEVREKALKAAAEMLEASAEDLELKDGAVQVKGVPQMRKTLAQIAHAIGGVPGFALPNGVTPGLASSVDFPAPALTYCNGTHVCEAEVDRDRRGALHQLCRGARQRAHHQSDDRRRPGDGRGGARHWRDPVRMDAVRRRRPAADRDLRRLPAAEHRHGAAGRRRSYGDADAAQSARRQGRGRKRHHRCPGRDRVGGGGRAEAVRRAHPRPAADTGAIADADPRGEVAVRPACVSGTADMPRPRGPTLARYGPLSLAQQQGTA